MNKILFLALLIGGVVLTAFGIDAYHSVGSGFSRWFTGSPTDKSIWMLIGGIAAVAVGAGGLMRGSKSL